MNCCSGTNQALAGWPDWCITAACVAGLNPSCAGGCRQGLSGTGLAGQYGQTVREGRISMTSSGAHGPQPVTHPLHGAGTPAQHLSTAAAEGWHTRTCCRLLRKSDDARPLLPPHLNPGFHHRSHQHCSAAHHIWHSWKVRTSWQARPMSKPLRELHGTTAIPCQHRVLKPNQAGMLLGWTGVFEWHLHTCSSP